jgi:hypothetical protein
LFNTHRQYVIYFFRMTPLPARAILK